MLIWYDAGMDYTLKRVRRSRSVKVRIEPNGDVLVTAPWLAPKFMIERFLKQNEAWITRQQKRTKLKSELYPTLDWKKKVVSYLGQLYQIRIMNNELRIMIKGQVIYLSPVTDLESDARKMLVAWLKRSGERYISEQLPPQARKMGLTHGTVRFRQQKSRWGSCSGQGNLSFNWRLIHFKAEIIQYVLIHELSHLRHHNHSRAFWELVEKFDRGYKAHRQFLHTQVVTLE
jgi:hypothetical protein